MKFLVLLITLFSYSVGFAQKTVFPDTFSFPIKPGKRNYLSGNFGELRSNHFHGGLDIKTDGKTGLPVYSAADGYVSKIVMSTSGYGNVLFVTHPNGYVTVYAHLERFNYAISKFIKEQQYKKQSIEPAYYYQIEPYAINKGRKYTFWMGEITVIKSQEKQAGERVQAK